MKRKLLAILVIAAMSVFGGALMAQDKDAPAKEADKAAAPAAKEKTLGDMWRAGGITMYPLGFFALFGATLVVYNFIVIRKNRFLNPNGVKEVEKYVARLDINGALDYCEKNPSPITNIIGQGLSRADEHDNFQSTDVSVVSTAMEEASVEEFATPYVFINYLSVIASLAPMLGLYGTVSGMVKAFNTIASEGAGSASKLADNIAEALITTAAGMIVGIPAMFFFFFFKNKFGTVISGSSRVIGDLMYTLSTAIKYGPQEIDAEDEAVATEAPAEEAPAPESEEK